MKGRMLATALCIALTVFGCGRPSSGPAAADLSPEDCGKEVRDCDLGELTPVPAGCKRASYEYAIAAEIDEGSYPFRELGCNEDYLSLRIDFGADACPPEATKEERERCARMKTAYFVADDGSWKLLTYERRTRCEGVQSLDSSFPTAFCSRWQQDCST
jgi:hypothetical protein